MAEWAKGTSLTWLPPDRCRCLKVFRVLGLGASAIGFAVQSLRFAVHLHAVQEIR